MTTLSREPEPLPTGDGNYRFRYDNGQPCQVCYAFDQLFTISLSTQPDSILRDKKNNPLTIITLSPVETTEIVKSILTAVRENEPQAPLLHTLRHEYKLESPYYFNLKATVQLDAPDDVPVHMLIITIPSPEESVPGMTAICEKRINGEMFQVTTKNDYIMRKYAIDKNWSGIDDDIYLIRTTLKEIAKRRNPQLYDQLAGGPHH